MPGQEARNGDGAPQPIIMITHDTTEGAIRAALQNIEKEGNVNEKPQMMRIEKM